jgi:hypothetical protein
MKFFIFNILLFISFLVFVPVHPVAAMPPLKEDSSAVELRKFDAGKINGYRSNKDFKYDLQKPTEMGFWDRFWFWVWEQYSRAMANDGVRVSFKIFLWALAIGVILFAIVKIVGMEKVAFLIRGRKETGLGYTEEQEDIYAIDFNRAIDEAVRNKEFRFATRLMYLQALRQLADKNLINWKINKTNDDYVRELSITSYGPGFNNITRSYEYVWYGEFEIEENAFGKVKQQFQQFNRGVIQ